MRMPSNFPLGQPSSLTTGIFLGQAPTKGVYTIGSTAVYVLACTHEKNLLSMCIYFISVICVSGRLKDKGGKLLLICLLCLNVSLHYCVNTNHKCDCKHSALMVCITLQLHLHLAIWLFLYLKKLIINTEQLGGHAQDTSSSRNQITDPSVPGQMLYHLNYSCNV